MLRAHAPRDRACAGLRGGCDALQVVGGSCQFGAGLPNAADGGIAAEACPAHGLVTGGPDVAVQGVDLIGQRLSADSKAERAASGCRRRTGRLLLIMVVMGNPSPARGATGAKTGANVFRPRPTRRDPLRAFVQVRESGPRFGFAQTRAYPPRLQRGFRSTAPESLFDLR